MSRETDDQPRGLYEKMKAQDEGWELWAKLAVGLLVLQVLAFGVAYLSVGEVSIYAHAMMIPALGTATYLLTFWGLIRALFRPPVLRLSRALAFGALLLVGLSGNAPVLTAPVSTGDWTSDHDYQLPFDGTWATMSGGDDLDTNHHATTKPLRWAYDFAPVVDGQRYEGDGSELEDHHCWGAPVRAPVDGRVHRTLSGEQDHPPGDYDPNVMLGNHIVFEVEADEFLFMGHLREGSVQVDSGEEIEAGDVVAECGNSGRTKTPHLHVHLQDRPDFPIAEGLPLRFDDYVADGEPVDRGMPVGSSDYLERPGQIVENRRSWDEMLGDTDEP